MKYIKFCLFVMITCFIYSTYAAVPTSKVINGIKDKFDQVSDYQATVTQENIDTKGNKTIYTGEVSFKKPQKIRVTYYDKKKKDPSQIVITDEEHMWLYTSELKQITRQKLDPKNLPLPLLILGGATQIDENFREKNYIKPIERISLNGKKVFKIIVKPKNKNTDYEQQTLWVDDSSYLPVKAELIDSHGNSSIVTFNNSKINQSLSDALFVMEKKPGVSYVEMPE